MNVLFRLSNELESVSIELGRAEDLISILSTNLFDEILTPYGQQFEAVANAAQNKVSEQHKIISELSQYLYRLSKDVGSENNDECKCI